MLSPSQTLLTHTHPLLKAWINMHSLFTERLSMALPIKITVYVSKKSRKYNVLTEPLHSTIPRQHQLCKYLL